MKHVRTEIKPPCETPCAACPWLTANHTDMILRDRFGR